jgi:hypothetical protein
MKSIPEIVGMLLEAGVDYYHVDYVTLRATYYNAAAAALTTPITFEGLTAVAADFDAAALRANILDSQRSNQHYRDFTRRAMQAGAQGYFAFLRGQRVTYFGRQGDLHTEWFPGPSGTGQWFNHGLPRRNDNKGGMNTDEHGFNSMRRILNRADMILTAQSTAARQPLTSVWRGWNPFGAFLSSNPSDNVLIIQHGPAQAEALL